MSKEPKQTYKIRCILLGEEKEPLFVGIIGPQYNHKIRATTTRVFEFAHLNWASNVCAHLNAAATAAGDTCRFMVDPIEIPKS